LTSPALRGLPLTFYSVAEPEPGPGWQGLFSSAWPAYRRWYLRDGAAARSGLRECQRMLGRHMPELVPTWRRLVELAGGDPLAAQMLTLYNPPPYIAGCSQAVHLGAERALVRNYDYAPELFERVVLGSSFTGRQVVGTSDCLWGLVDGMNDAGLAVSLAFGGRPTTGTGFGIPFLDPASDPVFTASPIATNHGPAAAPGNVGVPRSRERWDLLASLVDDPGLDLEQLVGRFLEPPLHSDAYELGFGTLYTAVYRPAKLWRSSTAGPVRPGSTPSARSPTASTRWCWARANGRGADRTGGRQAPGCGRRTRTA